MNNKRKNETLALLLTLLLSGVTALILVNSYLHYEPIATDNQLQLMQDSIMWGGEYVMLGDTPEPMLDEAQPSQEQAEEVTPEPTPDPQAVEGDDLEDKGEPTNTPKPVVTQAKESPMKVKEKPKDEPAKKPGPAVNKKTTEPQPKPEKPQVKQAAPSAANNRVKNAFSGTGGASGGKQGSPGGNSAEGVSMGRPGVSGLSGYTLENWAKPNPNSRWSGRINVKVRVNTRGKVIEAHATGGSGEAYTHSEIRTACEQAALKSSFSVPNNTTTEGVGTISYIWK